MTEIDAGYDYHLMARDEGDDVRLRLIEEPDSVTVLRVRKDLLLNFLQGRGARRKISDGVHGELSGEHAILLFGDVEMYVKRVPLTLWLLYHMEETR